MARDAIEYFKQTLFHPLIEVYIFTYYFMSQVKFKLSNIEASALSDFVVNCKTPEQVLIFTEFVEATITTSQNTYHTDIQRITKNFQEQIDAEGPKYLQKDEKGNYIKGPEGQPLPQVGKEEDWLNVFTGKQSEIQQALNSMGNTIIEYTIDSKMFNDFKDMFMKNNLDTFMSLQKDPKEVTNAFIMIYLIAKRLKNAEAVKVKGNSK